MMSFQRPDFPLKRGGALLGLHRYKEKRYLDFSFDGGLSFKTYDVWVDVYSRGFMITGGLAFIDEFRTKPALLVSVAVDREMFAAHVSSDSRSLVVNGVYPRERGEQLTIF